MGCEVIEKCGGGRVSEQELSGSDGMGMVSAKCIGEGDTERGHCECVGMVVDEKLSGRAIGVVY